LTSSLLSDHFLLPADFYPTAALKMNSYPSPNFSRLAVALITVCVLAGCATYSKVSEKRPRFVLSIRPVGMLANAKAGIDRAMRIDRRDPLVALGGYMSAAETALTPTQA
jgi:hypothetical protein